MKVKLDELIKLFSYLYYDGSPCDECPYEWNGDECNYDKCYERLQEITKCYYRDKINQMLGD